MGKIENIPWWDQSTIGEEMPGCWSDLRGPEGGDIACVHWCPNVPGRLWVGSAAGVLYHCNIIRSVWCHFDSHVISRAPIVNIEASCGAVPRLLIVDGDGTLTVTSDISSAFQRVKCDSSIHFKRVKSHPFIPGLVYGGTLEGLVCSVDGGITWNPIQTQTALGKVTAMEFHPDYPLQFYIADTLGNKARLLVTIDGGYTFEEVFMPHLRFESIHSIIFDATTALITLAGHGECRVARCANNQLDEWRMMHQGLPSSEITCMAGPDSNHTIWLGSQGAGIYRLDRNESLWRRADIEISRRYVQSIAVRFNEIAVGCLESGASVFINDRWSSKNHHVFARSLKRMEWMDGKLIVHSDNQLYLFYGRQWRQITGFPSVLDVIAGDAFIFALCNTDSIYMASISKLYWVKVPFEYGHAVRIFGDSTATDIYVIAHDSEYHHCIYRIPRALLMMGLEFEPDGSIVNRTLEWVQVTDEIPLKEHIFDVKVMTSNGSSRLAVATDMGFYFWNERSIGWEEQNIPDHEGKHVLAQNNHGQLGLYAGVGTELWYCRNWPDDSCFELIWRFPSAVSSIKVQGDRIQAIYVGTDQGELFASFLHRRFVSIPSSQLLPRINCITTSSSAIMIGTDGVSCKMFRTLHLTLQINRLNFDEMAVSVSLSNPGNRIDVDVYLLELLDDGSWRSYDVSHSDIKISPVPIPLCLTIESQTDGMEFFLGRFRVGTNPVASSLMAGLFRANSDTMIAPFSCIDTLC